MTDNQPTVSTKDDVARFDRRHVAVIGVYQAVAAPRKGDAPRQRKQTHALVRLKDGAIVYLEPIHSSAAKRNLVERFLYNGKNIVASGILHKIMPSEGEGLMAPCLSPVDHIGPAKAG